MKIATGMVCALQILSTVVVNSSLVSKYTKPSRATSGRSKTFKFIMEKFVSGFCKNGDLDLTMYDISASQCIQECRARTMCKSINMFTRVNICKINFEGNLTLEKCKMYFHSDRANWKQKTEPGCESLNCSIIQKCIKTDGKYSCVYTECMNILHLQNGMVFGNHLQTNLTKAFMCNQGYELKGASVITCQGDGKWSHEVPVCVAKTTSPTHSLTSTRTSDTTKTSRETLMASTTTRTSRKTQSMTTSATTKSSPETQSGTTSTTTSPETQSMTTLTTTKLSPETQSGMTSTTTKTSQDSQSKTSSTTIAPKAYDTTASIATTSPTTSDNLQTSIGPPSQSCPTEPYSEANNCENSDDNTCPFPEVFDPRKNRCVDDCENSVFGTTYQVHQGKGIAVGLELQNILETSANNKEECFETCRRTEKCVAISYTPQLYGLKYVYVCSFYIATALESLNSVDVEGYVTYLRNCQDIDQGGLLPFYLTAGQCNQGELLSESQQACFVECNQISHTFQLIDNYGIDTEKADETEIFRVSHQLEEDHFMDCLAGCVEYRNCAFVVVKRFPNTVECNFYAKAQNYNELLVPSITHKVFLRNCE